MGTSMTVSNNHKARSSGYTRYQVNLFRTRMPIFWWVHKFVHVRFITRELTSVAVALYSVVLLLYLRALAQGPEAYERFLSLLQTPVSITLHAIALLFVLFHSFTWLSLAPKALAVKLGGKRLSDAAIVIGNYFGWAVCSAFVAWIVMTL